jgi:hypothetical protein
LYQKLKSGIVVYMSENAHEHSNTPLYLIFFATFVFGLVAGGLGFFFSSTGGNATEGVVDTATKGFIISAYQYGRCTGNGGCPSYQIQNNGSYVYIVRDKVRGETKYEGSLSKKQYDALKGLVATTEYERTLSTQNKRGCAGDSDAYRYDVAYTGQQYSFDSCTRLLTGVALFETLQEYFGVFRIQYGVE